jgi:hypothetical protein
VTVASARPGYGAEYYLDHLGDLATVWLYRNDRQIKRVSYRETEASHPSYTVTLRALDGHPDQE